MTRRTFLVTGLAHHTEWPDFPGTLVAVDLDAMDVVLDPNLGLAFRAGRRWGRKGAPIIHSCAECRHRGTGVLRVRTQPRAASRFLASHARTRLASAARENFPCASRNTMTVGRPATVACRTMQRPASAV